MRSLFFFRSMYVVASVVVAGALCSCDDDDEAPALEVTAINPSSAMSNAVVSITGQGFSPVFNDNKVSFNGKPSLVSNASPTQLIVVVPADAQTGPVAVTVNGREASNKPVFTVESLPSIISNVSPLMGKYNSIVTITGANFHSTPGNNIVTFNGIAAIVESATSTTLSVKVPLRAGTGPIVVNGVSAGSRFNYIPDVYVVGYVADNTGEARATYWKNGAPTILSSTGLDTYAYDIACIGDDVFVSGSRYTGIMTVARIWKNGTEIPLTDGTRGSQADAMVAIGEDIYVAGSESNGSYMVAKYWKNGSAVNLSDGTAYAQATSITVEGQDVYVGGNSNDSKGNTFATIWKNGVPQYLTKRVSFSWGLYVSEGNVYSTGSIRNKMAGNGFVSYWQNADSVLLGPGIGGGAGRDIVVAGGDVYVAGEEDNEKFVRLAKYWKNGSPVILSDGATVGAARGIDVLGDDVYVVGFERNAAGVNVATLWKNGVPISLSDGSNYSTAESVLVR